MIEAINSVLSNVAVNRGAVEQQSSARVFAANPERKQEAAQAKAPYVSPAISIDKQSSKAIIQIRDSDTGDVVRQFPTEGQLKAYRTAQEFSERQKASTETQVREATGSINASASSDVDVPAISESSASSSQPAPQTTSVRTEA